MTDVHHLTPGDFALLSTGGGGPSALRVLQRAQLSKHTLFIKFIAEQWPGPSAERDAALAVLDEAQAHDRAAVDALLGDPLVGIWAARLARHLAGRAAGEARLHEDPAHLGAVAAAAAIRAGTAAEVPVVVPDGCMTLPTLGRISVGLPRANRLSVRPDSDEVRITGSAGSVGVRMTGSDETWQPLRYLEAAATRIALDDIDPYRNGYHVPATSRLDPGQFARWQSVFRSAWHLLCRYVPHRAAELAVGLRSVVPLAEGAPGTMVSGTVRDAFGIFGSSLPPSPAEFAVTMVHEFQHSKLNGVLELATLYERDEELYIAPWRADPRPLGGLFQGVYAFLAVAETWHLLMQDDHWGALAARNFASTRLQVDAGLRTLTGSGRLTPTGERFAAGMRTTVDGLLTVPLPASVIAAARADSAH